MLADPSQASPPERVPTAIVAVGASAGGLQPIKELIGSIPDGSGMSVIVLQHIASEHETLLPEFLRKITEMPVSQIEDGIVIEPNHIYVAPGGQTLEFDGLTLRFSSHKEAPGPRTVINGLFQSLAYHHRENAVGIILSGTGSDGTEGIRDIKEYAGMTMAQEPDEAENSSMPRSAIQSHKIDYVLPASKLGEALLHYIEHNELFQHEPVQTDDFTKELHEILTILNKITDQDYRSYKSATLLRRIQRRMGLCGIDSMSQYGQFLNENRDEVKALVEDLLINVTAFFRDPEVWEMLKEEVLQPLVAEWNQEKPIRIWVPGCATGEEAYSVAMIMQELKAERPEIRTQIFATDLSNHALKTARRATYPLVAREDVGESRFSAFFKEYADGCTLTKSIRERVVFASHDLRSDPPFGSLDLVCCRNLLIYLQKTTQRDILRKFHFALNQNGVLLLGSAETPSSLGQGFQAISTPLRIFRKVQVSFEDRITMRAPYKSDGRTEAASGRSRDQPGPMKEVAADLIMEEKQGACFILNQEGQMLHASGQAADYVRLPDDAQRFHLLNQVHASLQRQLRAAMEKVANGGGRAHFYVSQFKDREAHIASLRGVVKRIDSSQSAEGHFFVYLEKNQVNELSCTVTGKGENEKDPETTIRLLQDELQGTRSELSRTIDQLERTNQDLRVAHEEAISVNEELQSGNEELESSKEELQSLNEELTTLNVQLEEKIHEVVSTNNDLDNLLASTRIAVVFLDRKSNIRNFTPEAINFFNLIAADIGRPLSDLTSKFKDAKLIEQVQAVLRDFSSREEEVEMEDGRTFMRRVLPYRTQEDRIEGVVATFHDITHLKEIQAKLEEGQQALRLITDAIPGLVAYVDRDLYYRFANATYKKWFGIDPEALVGQYLPEVAGEEACEALKDVHERVLAGERQVWEGEINFRFDGKRMIRAEYIPHLDDEGRVRGFYTLIQDIRHRVESDAALIRSEKEYRAIFELGGSAKVKADAKTGRFLRTNQRFRDMLGYTEEEIMQLGYAETLHPEENVEEWIASLGHYTSESVVEQRFLRKDGSTIWILTSGVTVPGDRENPAYNVATLQDISGLKMAEFALRRSEERFRAVADNISQLAWIADSAGNFDWYNQRWYAYTGRDVETMRGRAWEKIVRPDYLKPVAEKLDAALQQGKSWEDIVPLRREDGVYRWFLSRAVPFRQEESNKMLWFGTNTDITEHMELEAALKEADRRKNEFISTLAHELRNPLAPLKNGVDLLRKGSQDLDRQQKVVASMGRQIGHLVRLVDDLMDASRISRGKVQLQREWIHLEEVIEAAVEAIEGEVTKKSHQLHLDVPKEMPPIYADGARLTQVFTNLLNNSVKYTASGGRIELKAWMDDTDCHVCVWDNGVGLPPDKAAQIFELFIQADGYHGPLDAGLGIGLSVVRSMVELHGGRVTAESDGKDKGAKFDVVLPIGPIDAEQAPVSPEPRERESSKTSRILVADDNQDAADGLGLMLEALGHEVQMVYGGMAALEAAERFEPHLVLLDLGMPDLPGTEVAQRLRATAHGKKMILVALTGWGEEEDRRRTREAGFDHHLTKPADAEQVESLLAQGED